MRKIPENYIDFLYWIKAETEKFWENMPKYIQNEDIDEYENNMYNQDWMIGAKWIGLKESEVKNIEKKYDISFSTEHKEFLKILHTIDKRKSVQYCKEDNNEIFTKEISFFYNWLTDDDDINLMMNFPYQEILSDIKRGSWVNSFGKEPNNDIEKEKIFLNWYNKAPKLIPIYLHRFVVSLFQKQNPVLSIYGMDTIVYGWSMKHYLLEELKEYLDLSEPIFDKEDNLWYSEDIEEFQDFRDYQWALNEDKGVPFWNEIINYYSPKWKYTPKNK